VCLLRIVLSIHTEWYKEHQDIPSLDEVKALYKKDLLKPNDKGYARQKKLLICYFDNYVAKLVGDDRWGVDKRYYSLPVSNSNEEIYGKERTLVTAQSEAWGWMMLENCRDKWDAHCEAKRADSSFKVPTYGKKKTEVHKFFTCKYSNAFCGQKPGWDPAVFKVLDDYNAEIQAFRKKDSKKGWNYFKAVKDLLREANDISEQVPIPTK